MLEKKEKVLLKKVSAEVEKAKEFTKAMNKRGINHLPSLISIHIRIPVGMFFFYVFNFRITSIYNVCLKPISSLEVTMSLYLYEKVQCCHGRGEMLVDFSVN